MFRLLYKYFYSVMFGFLFLSISLAAESRQVSLDSNILQKELSQQPTGHIKPTPVDNALQIKDISKCILIQKKEKIGAEIEANIRKVEGKHEAK